MEKKQSSNLLMEQIELANTSAGVFQESLARTQAILAQNKASLTVAERETLEALSSRFARLSDLVVQKLFRTLDQVELSDEGSVIDRLNRMEKRGIIESATVWRTLRELRNEISHEYLIDRAKDTVLDVVKAGPELLAGLENLKNYVREKGL